MMNTESSLSLLRESFRKCRIRTWVEPLEDLEAMLSEYGIETALGIASEHAELLRRFPRRLLPRTMYKVSDTFEFSYIGLLLPEEGQERVLCIGPYLPSPMSSQDLLEVGERNRVSPKQQRYLEEYYNATPVLPDGDHLLILLDAFCEQIWQTSTFSILDRSQEYQLPASPINQSMQSDSFDEVLVNAKNMEKRYGFENELMRAVSLGQLHKEKQLIAAFSQKAFERRLADPLRNAKNYDIIMNTLLRKAAEAGGVHPIYLDQVSSTIAAQIEQLPSLSENTDLMRSIFRTYCRLVRNHSLQQYSQAVQKAILLIDSDLSANLSLNALAKHQGISPGYLSAVFKKETGKTVSEYIRLKRVKHATHLLATTNLQIQTVALHCGIMDVQYFSKIFKRATGKTPKEYRESVKKSPQ